MHFTKTWNKTYYYIKLSTCQNQDYISTCKLSYSVSNICYTRDKILNCFLLKWLVNSLNCQMTRRLTKLKHQKNSHEQCACLPILKSLIFYTAAFLQSLSSLSLPIQRGKSSKHDIVNTNTNPSQLFPNSHWHLKTNSINITTKNKSNK